MRDKFTYHRGVERKLFSKHIDKEIIRIFDKEISKAFEEMPELRDYIKIIGSKRQISKQLEEDMYLWLLDYYLCHGNNLVQAQILAYRETENFSGINMSTDTIAQFNIYTSNFKDSNQQIFNRYSGIYLNDKWKKITALNRTIKLYVNNGIYTKGSGNIRQIINHELGHAIAYMLNLDNHPFILLIYSKYKYALSLQASIDPSEYIAETWAEYKTGKSPRPIAIKLGKFIEKQYKRFKRNYIKKYDK